MSQRAAYLAVFGVIKRVLAALVGACLVAVPASADTLVDNVVGYTLNSGNQLVTFNGLIIADDGRVRQLLQPRQKRPYARYKADGRGRVLLPGRIETSMRLLSVGARTPFVDTKHAPENPVVREAMLTGALDLLASRGVTMVHDTGATLEDWLLYRRFGDEGRLSVRIYALADGIRVAEQVAPLRPTPWLYQDRLAMRAVLFRTEDLREKGDTRLKNWVSRALVSKLQPVIVAKSPAEMGRALDVYEELEATYGKTGRMRLEHPEPISSADQARASQLEIIALSSSPSASPIPAAVTAPMLVEQSVRGAYAAFAEDRVGTLEPGKWADFILVERLSGPNQQAVEPRVSETWVGGRRVWVAAAK